MMLASPIDQRAAAPRSALFTLVALAFVTACSPAVSPGANESDSASHEMSEAPASASAAAETEPSASEDPLAVCEGVEPEGEPLEVVVGTVSYAFDVGRIEGPRHCEPFVIEFTNSDRKRPGVQNEHDINIRLENLIGPLLFDGELIGSETIRYEVPGMPAGEHYFYCSAHSGMSGKVLVAPPEG